MFYTFAKRMALKIQQDLVGTLSDRSGKIEERGLRSTNLGRISRSRYFYCRVKSTENVVGAASSCIGLNRVRREV